MLFIWKTRAGNRLIHLHLFLLSDRVARGTKVTGLFENKFFLNSWGILRRCFLLPSLVVGSKIGKTFASIIGLVEDALDT